MSVRPITRFLATAMAAVAPALVLAANPPAKAKAPAVSGLHARIGRGDRVDLAASSLTKTQLAALRPNYEKLKPRVRSNAE